MNQNFGGISLSKRVGNYLRANLGRNKPISREKFASDFSIDDKTVQRWINNGVNKLDTVDEIAYYFGVSVMDIISEEDDVLPVVNIRKDIFCPFGFFAFVVF